MSVTYWQGISHIIGPARAHEFSNIAQQDTRTAIEDFIITHSNDCTTVLDAGCNTGVEGYRLFERGFSGSYTGIDSNAKALSFALENLSGRRASFMLADLGNIPLPDRCAEIVLNKDVIEHCEYYHSVLAELARLTRNYLVLSFFIQMSDEPDSIEKHPDGYYLNRYNRAGLYSFLAAEGLKNAQCIFRNQSDEVLVFSREN
ncbi:MAG: hypothetical protein DCC75_06285 [Proteobacteria bacterium]|nr:MAG: hypothetical protein DCC75_06285 [Pseudomonadota bacterium]